MTGWRLFADVREQHHITWAATAIYTDGTEGPLELDAPGSSGTPFVMGRLTELSEHDRDRLCSQWLRLGSGERTLGRIAISRETRDLADRQGTRSAPPVRRLAFVCSNDDMSADPS
jgi:hypothetical protein